MRFNIRVKHHPNGTCTISGMPSRVLSSVMTSASLHHFETEDGIKAKRLTLPQRQQEAYPTDALMQQVLAENQANDELWAREVRRVIEAFSAPRYDHGYHNVPVTQLDQLGRFCRRRDVDDSRRGRLAIAAIMEEFTNRTSA